MTIRNARLSIEVDAEAFERDYPGEVTCEGIVPPEEEEVKRMAAGHTVVSRENVPVRRSEYEGGTVSYDWEENGRKIRVSFRANGEVRVHFPNDVVGIVGLRGTQTWTNVDLAPIK